MAKNTYHKQMEKRKANKAKKKLTIEKAKQRKYKMTARESKDVQFKSHWLQNRNTSNSVAAERNKLSIITH